MTVNHHPEQLTRFQVHPASLWHEASTLGPFRGTPPLLQTERRNYEVRQVKSDGEGMSLWLRDRGWWNRGFSQLSSYQDGPPRR